MKIENGIIGNGEMQGSACAGVGVLDNPAYDRQPGWQRLGTVMPDGITSVEEGLEIARANFDVAKEPLSLYAGPAVTELGGDQVSEYVRRLACCATNADVQEVFRAIAKALGSRYIPVPSAFATCRMDLPKMDPRRVLGVVGDRYEVIQNAEACQATDAIVGESGGTIDSIGTLRNGRTVWVCIKLPGTTEIRGNGLTDAVAPYLVGSTSHDGSQAMTWCATPVRVVCWNTLTAAIRGARSKFTIRHTVGAKVNITEARKVLANTQTYMERTGERLQRFADQSVSDLFVRAYLEASFPAPKPRGDSDKDVSDSRAVAARAKVAELFYSRQAGANHPALNGTAYGLVNAMTAFIDHHRTTRTSEGRSAVEARLDSVWFGTGAKMREDAFELMEECVIGADGQETLVSKAERVGREQLADGWNQGQQQKAVDDLLAQIDVN